MDLYILEEIDLHEISGVDDPAQPTAKATIIKRNNQENELGVVINKAYQVLIEEEKIKDFNIQLDINEKQQKLWDARSRLYPLFDALNQTIGNIVSDPVLSSEQKKEKVKQNSEDFSVKVIAEIPDVVSELTKLFKNAGISSFTKTNEEKMSEKVTDIEKALAKNEEALAEVTKSLEDANAKSSKAFAELDALMSMTQVEFETFKAMDADKKKELLELDEKERKKKLAKSAESEEIVKFEGKEIRKSAVGAESFAVYKRMVDMEAEVVKANEAATMVRLEKRASEEFAHLAGKPSEVAAVLKAMDAMPADAKATLEAIMKAAEVAAAEAFVTKGTEKAAEEAEVTKRSRDEKVSDIMKSRNVSKTRAMEIAAAEAPELFK